MKNEVKLVQLDAFRNRALAATLRDLAQLAEDNVIHGVVFVAKFGPGDHRAGASGDYKTHAAEALNATFLLERFLAGTLPQMLYEGQGSTSG